MTPRLFVFAWTFAMATFICAGTLNLSEMLPDPTERSIHKSASDEEASNEEASSLRPPGKPSKEALKVDKDLPPLILPAAGGLIVLRLSDDPPGESEGPAVVVALDPETQKKLWEIPELNMKSSAGWVGTETHIVTLGEDGTLVIINAEDGEQHPIEGEDGSPQELCKGDEGEVFLEMEDGSGQRINPSEGSVTATDEQHPCSMRPEPPKGCQESPNALSRSSACLGPEQAPKGEDIEGKFALNDGETSVLFGTDPATKTKIILMGFDEGADTSKWAGPLPSEGDSAMEQSATEIADGTIYVTAREEGEAWSLFAMDGESGESMWTTPIDDTKESSMDRGISVVDGTVYLLDEEKLHRIDAASGKLLDDLKSERSLFGSPQ